MRAEYLQEVQADAMPPTAKKVVEDWIDAQISTLTTHLRESDEIWYYKYEKCCGWYRAGYVVIRAGCPVFEINTREDM